MTEASLAFLHAQAAVFRAYWATGQEPDALVDAADAIWERLEVSERAVVEAELSAVGHAREDELAFAEAVDARWALASAPPRHGAG